MAQELQERFGQAVIVDNKPGVGGRLAADSVLAAPADGLTYMVAPNATPTFQMLLFKDQLKWNSLKDFVPVASFASFPREAATLAAVASMQLDQGAAEYGTAALGEVPGALLVAVLLFARSGLYRPRETRPGGAQIVAGLFVAGLFVTDAWRGRGLGSALLSRAEIYAAVQGCGNAWLDTFQARSFYLRQGWEVFGSLPEYPAGQTRYFMRKRLLGGS